MSVKYRFFHIRDEFLRILPRKGSTEFTIAVASSANFYFTLFYVIDKDIVYRSVLPIKDKHILLKFDTITGKVHFADVE